MIEHLKTCDEVKNLVFDCPKCKETKFSRDELLKHLKTKCSYMKVVCKMCEDTPVQRIGLRLNDHTDI